MTAHKSVLLPVPLYILYTVGLLTAVVLAWTIDWQGSGQLHTVMETAAMVLAWIIGVIGLLRFYSKPSNAALFIGAGFMGAAFLDGYHAVVTSSFFAPYLPSDLPALAPWSWFASRIYLSLFLLIGLVMEHRGEKQNGPIAHQPAIVLAGAALMTVFSFLFFVFVTLPRGHYPEFILQRPYEFLPAFFFTLTLIGYLRKGDWKIDDAKHWLVLFLGVSCTIQILVMPGSTQLFDAQFDVAHSLKIASYTLILTGLLISIYRLFRQADEDAETVKKTNQTLTGEIQVRHEAEKALKGNQDLLNSAEAVAHLGSGEWYLKTDKSTWSDETFRIFGFEPGAEEPGYDLFERVLHPNDRERILGLLQETLHNDTPFDTTYKIIRPNGEIRSCHAVARVFRDVDGQPERLVSTVMDITDRKRAEQDLKEKQHLLDAFQRIGEAAISTFESERIYDGLVEEVVKAGIFRSLTIAIVDRDALMVHVVKSSYRRPSGEISDMTDKTAMSYSLNEDNIMAETARTGEIQVIEGWDDRFDNRVDTPSDIYQDKVSYFIPVNYNQKTLAVLATASTRAEKEDTLRRLEAMQSLVNLVAIALNQARLYEESRTYSDSLTEKNAALAESESRFRGIFSSAAIGITLVDTWSGKWLMVNPAFCQMTGYSEEELLTMEVGDITPPEDLAIHHDYFHQYLAREVDTFAVDKRYIRKDGAVIWVHLTGRMVTDADDKPIYSIFGIKDVTEQKMAEEALDRAYHREEAIARIRERILAMRHLEELHDLLTSEWRETLISFGIPVHQVSWQLPGLADDHYISNRLRSDEGFLEDNQVPISAYPWLQRAWETGQPALATRDEIFKYRQNCPPEVEVLLEVPLPGIRGSIGLNSCDADAFGPEEIRYIQMFSGLISEGLMRVHDFETLEKHAEELEASNKELEQFAYVASHDLQEPLRMVVSYLQLLERRYKEKLDESAVEFIDYAVDGAKRMQTLINDLLAYSRVGTKGKSFEECDVNEVVNRVLNTLQLSITDQQAEVTCDELPVVKADAGQLGQLFQNLISNGLKFQNENPPRIHIGCKRQGGAWTFSVKDNGIGIEPQYADRIFVIFQRLHTRDEYKGTGIGLAICKKIVERHGGRIWLDSEVGQGTVFHFTIPSKV